MVAGCADVQRTVLSQESAAAQHACAHHGALLSPQRTVLSQESSKLKVQLEVEAKWRYTTSAELSRLREALEVRLIATDYATACL